jgi:transcriptional regulator with XRE-family HTH domain
VATRGDVAMRDWEYLNPEQCRIVRETRKYLGLTQKKLAEEIHVSESLFSHIARGQHTCTAEQRKILEQELGLEVNSLSSDNPFLTQEHGDKEIVQTLKLLLTHATYLTDKLHDIEAMLKRQYATDQAYLDSKIKGWSKTLAEAQSNHQDGAPRASRRTLEPLFNKIYNVIKSIDEPSNQDQREQAIRLLTDVFVNLSFDYNVLLSREELIRQAAPYRQRVEKILRLVPTAVDPMAQASFDYGVAETYHVLQNHGRAEEYARKVLSVKDHPLRRFAQRLVIINSCYVNYSNIREEIAIGRKMLASIGEDAQLREGIGQALVLSGDQACKGELAKVMRAGMDGQPIVLTICLRTKMKYFVTFYPGDTEKLFQVGRQLKELATPLRLEKYLEQADEIGRAGGIEFWVDDENNICSKKIT